MAMIKVSVSLDRDLLRRIDELAREEGTSRSAFIREAIRFYLERRHHAKGRNKTRAVAARTERIGKKYLRT